MLLDLITRKSEIEREVGTLEHGPRGRMMDGDSQAACRRLNEIAEALAISVHDLLNSETDPAHAVAQDALEIEALALLRRLSQGDRNGLLTVMRTFVAIRRPPDAFSAWSGNTF